MGKVIAVISGKGGTGKTTLCAGIAACLAAEGKRVLCMDADICFRNLDIALGMSELATLSFADLLSGYYTLDQAAQHPQIPNLYLLTAPVDAASDSISTEAFGELLHSVREQFDFCLIDAPAGVGTGLTLATTFADRILVIANADPASQRDAAHAVELLQGKHHAVMHLVVNRIVPEMYRRMAVNIDDIMDEVGLPLLGIVPEDRNVTLAAASGKPLVLFTGKGACVACLHIARRLAGKTAPLMRIR